MSHSVPSDSSLSASPLADSLFLRGPDLVSFDRRDLPIYASHHSLWAQSGNDAPAYGTSLDRVYGEPGEIFIASVPLVEEPREFVAPASDPLVMLGNLTHGLVLPVCEQQPALGLHAAAAHTPGMEAIYQFLGDPHTLLPVHDGGGAGWDLAKPDWFYEHHI